MNFIQLLQQELSTIFADNHNFKVMLILCVVVFIAACFIETCKIVVPLYKTGDLVAIYDNVGVYRVLSSTSDAFNTLYKLQNVEDNTEKNLICELTLKPINDEHIRYLNDKLSLLELMIGRGQLVGDSVRLHNLQNVLDEINKRGE